MAALILQPERIDREDAHGMIARPPRGTVAERLHVYAGGYPARIQESLEESFPAVAHVLGPRAFTSLTHRYLRAVPPPSYNLNDVGAALPDFLRGDALTPSLPFLPDLARLEWQLTRAFHAFDEPPLDPTVLSAWSTEDWERAILRFQPSVALVTSEWPIRSIWEARETPVDEIDLDLRDRPDRVLIYRSALTVHCESLGVDEAAALNALLDERTLGEVSEALAAAGHAPGTVSEWFARWMSLGIIRGCNRAPR